MKAIIETISSIDENSKKILFKHFNQDDVNILSKSALGLMEKIRKVGQEAQELEKVKEISEIDEAGIIPDSDGNHSEEDEINKIEKLRN